jgi:hypothetical protein
MLHFTRHALNRMRRLGIKQSEVESILRASANRTPDLEFPREQVFGRLLDGRWICVVVVEECTRIVVVTIIHKER